MTQRTRTILFLSMLIVFIAAAPSIIFYSEGYRIDFKNKKIVQTGGIFIKAEPKQLEIYLNGKLEEKTDFFFGQKLIENLLPKKYLIEIKKEGYLPWRKELEIKEKMVTEAKSIFLFPKKHGFSSLAKNIENFWVTPDGKKIIFMEKTGLTWALKLFDLNKNLKSHLIEEKEISLKGADLLKLEFAENSQEIYFTARAGEQEKNFVLNLENPVNSLKERKNIPEPKNVSEYLKQNKITFSLKQETKYDLKIFSDYVFLQEDKDLYLFNKNSSAFEKFFEGLEDMKISEDSKKIVFISNSEIWVLFLKDILEQPQRKAGEKIFLTRLSEKINDIFWLNNDYLVFTAGDKIKIAEIDNRDRAQTWDIGNFPSPKLFFNEADEKLYILSENTLYKQQNLE